MEDLNNIVIEYDDDWGDEYSQWSVWLDKHQEEEYCQESDS